MRGWITRRVLDALLQHSHQIGVIELAIASALETAELPFAGFVVNALFIPQQPLGELLRIEFAQGLRRVWKQAFEEVVQPLLVAQRDGRMKAIEEVELDRHLVADASGHPLAIELLVDLDAWIQGPTARGMMGVGESSQIVVQRDVDIQPADDAVGDVSDLTANQLRGGALTAVRSGTNRYPASRRILRRR